MGTAHVFPGTTSDCSTYGNENINVYDGSGYFLQAGTNSFTLKNPSGKTINPPVNATGGAGNVIDTNGNIISTTTSGIEDTTGTTVLSIAGSGTPSSPKTLSYPVWESGATDTTGTVTIHYTSYNVQTAYGCTISGTGVGEYSGTVNLPSSVSLADGETYTFTYEPTPGYAGDVTGRLSSITLPTGGVISYAYSGGSNGIVCVDGGAATLTRTESSSTGTPTWTYARTPGASELTSHTDVTDGLSNHQSHDFVAVSGDPRFYETERKIYEGAASGTPLLATGTCYNGATSPCTTQTISALPSSIVQTKTLDGVETSETASTYNSNSLITEEDDYDFGSSGPGAPLRKTQTSYATLSSGMVNAPSSVIVYDGDGHEISGTSYGYDETTPSATSGLPQHTSAYGGRGNLTSVSLVNQAPQAWQVSHFTYDDAGQMQTSSDPYGNQTSYTYDTSTDTFQTQVTMPTTGTTAHHTSATWDVASGANKTTVDQNSNTTSYTYDILERSVSTSYPDGGATSLAYSLSASSPYTSVSVLHAGSSWITSKSYLDPYGRTQQTDQTDSPHDDLVSYSYDGNGNTSSVSNPYRTGDTPVYTTAAYDALGRATSVTETDSSVIGYAYSGNAVTFTDEASNQRRIVLDGLGRTSKVFEPNTGGSLLLETDYLYNQNWTYSGSTGVSYQTIVDQKGGSASPGDWRTRTLTYDQLSRLITESTPEAGTTSYNYWISGSYSTFCSGNLSLPCSRTDANSTVKSYSYDALNRLTGKTYSGSSIGTATPSVTYDYDQSSYNGLTISNGVGQRTGMSDGSGATAWSFDSMGRTAALRKTINSVTKQANFTYNDDGTQNTIQDFSGTTFTYAYTAAGLPSGVSDGSGYNWASSGTYNAAGQLTGLSNQLTIPYPVMRSVTYNNRLQPASIIASIYGYAQQVLHYTYGTAGHNNGNISYIQNGMSGGDRDQTFGYDNLNRVTSAGDESHWGESYTYDDWGNMTAKTITRGTGYSFSVTANGNNQLSNLSYDSAGEVIQDQFGNTFSYDAEGRILTAGSGTYVYDGDGNRVKKTNGSGTTLYWPGAASGVLDESNSSATSFGRQIYLGNLRIWSEDGSGTGRFLLQDHLGSTRVTISPSGSTEDSLDYRAFGDIVANYGGSPSDNHYTFTGYESDQSDSSTDYAVFRNLETTMGRFNRPDPYDGSYDPSNPQSLNRYAYALDAPVTLADPSGLDPNCVDGDDDNIGCEGDGEDGQNTGQDGQSDGPVVIPIPTSIPTIPPNTAVLEGPIQGPAPCTGFCDNFGASASATAYLIGVQFMPHGSSGPSNQPQVPVHGPWHYGNYCGAGGMGTPTNAVDAACAQHDACFAASGADWTNMQSQANWQQLSPSQQSAVSACNQQLCNAMDAVYPSIPWWNISRNVADVEIYDYFTYAVPKGARCHR
jgi:RHS repeat-associated protein